MKGIKNRVLSSMPKEEKVELQAEQIELGALDDLEKAIKKLSNSRVKLDSSLSDWYDKVFNLKSEFSNIDKLNSNFEKELSNVISKSSKIEKSAKELGINANDLDVYKRAIAAINTADDMTSEYKTGKSTAKKLI